MRYFRLVNRKYLKLLFNGKGDCMSFTYYREIDRLGRVVVPMDIRKSLSINAGDVLKISADDSKIILQKAEDKCVFCNGTDDLREFEGKFVCSECRAKLSR